MKRKIKIAGNIANNKILVNVWIFKGNIPIKTKALIDTGATGSFFYADARGKYDLKIIDKGSYTGCSSNEEIETNRLEGKILLGDKLKHQFNVTIQEVHSHIYKDADMVIGIDILKLGKIKIKKGKFYWSFWKYGFVLK